MDSWIERHIRILTDMNSDKEHFPTILPQEEKEWIHKIFQALIGKAYVECGDEWTYEGYVLDGQPVIEVIFFKSTTFKTVFWGNCFCTKKWLIFQV